MKLKCLWPVFQLFKFHITQANPQHRKHRERFTQLMRFRLIFDREGYSPGLFKRMAAKRIACQTYHKHPGENWLESEFRPHPVALMMGGYADMDRQYLWCRNTKQPSHQTNR